MRFALLIGALALLALPAAAQECPHPYVIVIKKDGTLVEGPLIRDANRGVVLQQDDGRALLIQEDEIEEVIEDCGRTPQTVVPPAATAARPMEANVRNTTVNIFQQGMRFVGTGCLTLGCGLASTGLVTSLGYILNGFVMSQNADQPIPLEVFQVAGVFLAGFGAAAVLSLGSGAGLLIGAQAADLLKATAPQTAEAEPAKKGDSVASADGRRARAMAY